MHLRQVQIDIECCWGRILGRKRSNSEMKSLKYTALLATLALAFSLSSFAKDKNEHTVTLSDSVRVGGTQLKPGDYKLEWQGTGAGTQVSFVQHGKTVATAPATLKTNDDSVTQDAVVMGTNSPRELKEIDFRHQKEALVFDQSGM
jgi:hypothetical protein